MGQHDVILVEIDDPVGARRLQGAIARPGAAAVGLADHPQTPIRRGELSQDCGGVVARAVVDRHKLEIAMALRQHALDRLAQKFLAIVDQHDH
jgi:hypothetical protein